MEEKQPKQKPFTEQFDTVMAFLCLEAIALTCFGIGGATGLKILEIVGFFVGAFTVPFIRLNFSRKDLSANFKWLIPLGVFMLLMGFSGFFIRYYGGFGLTSIVYCLLESLGLLGFFLLGFGVRQIPVVKREYILYAILGGLALYCVVVGAYSIVRYGLFYAARYHGLYYYYKGVLFPVFQEGKALVGFSFAEASLDYAVVPSMILGCAGAGLIGRNPKKDPRSFAILATLSSIGVLYSLLIPYWPSLVVMALAYLFALTYYLVRRLGGDNPNKKARTGFAVVYFALIAVVLLVVVLLLLENRLGLINKLFNAVLGRVPSSVQAAFSSIYDAIYNGADNAPLHQVNLASLLFGYQPEIVDGRIALHFSRFFEINVLWQNGLIAFLLLLGIVFFFIKNSRDYLALGKEDLPFRIAVVAMMLGLFVYMSLFDDEMPLVHDYVFAPFGQSNHFLLLFFLMGLSFLPSKPKEVAVNE
ncbi:MAG: hypothetical protein K6E59_03085 [Bacilli bacterium]|nr:hypothetical protein [Bacilli bacterium]